MSAAVAAETVVDSLASLRSCGAALVYRWDADQDCLRLWASAPQQLGIFAEEIALGSGVVGRAALRRDSAVIGTLRAGDLSRAAIAPNRAVVGLPVAAPNGELFAVVALIAGGPGPIAPDDVRVATDATRLFALALEHERVAAAARLHEDLSGSIEHIVDAADSETPLADVLQSISQLGLRALHLDACGVFALKGAYGHASLAAIAPRDTELLSACQGSVAWKGLWDANRVQVMRDPSGQRAILLVPAMLRGACVGVVALAASAGSSFCASDRARAEQLGRIVALAIRLRRRREGLFGSMRAEDVLWEVLGPRSGDSTALDSTALLARAHRLGCDLARRHVVIVASAAARAGGVDLRSALRALDRFALCDVSNGRLTAIAVEGAAMGLESTGWSLGVSQACDDLARYPLAHRQAQEAHDLGRALFGAGRIVRYDDLGTYRFVPALLESNLTNEAEYLQISRLPDELLKTLEVYLDHGCNTARAANQLFLHRNTLRQRLNRISTLLDRDLTQPRNWLPLQLVVKTARIARQASGPTS